MEQPESFQINIFTDKNLWKNLLNGWSEEKLIEGKIKTLTSRTFPLQVLPTDTGLQLKRKIQDLEGILLQIQRPHMNRC